MFLPYYYLPSSIVLQQTLFTEPSLIFNWNESEAVMDRHRPTVHLFSGLYCYLMFLDNSVDEKLQQNSRRHELWKIM